MSERYFCPLCHRELRMHIGDAVHPGNEEYGVALYCAHTDCPAQEVMGHGKSKDAAFKVIQEKFGV